MLKAGLKRALVEDCLAARLGALVLKIADLPLSRAFAADVAARREIGNGRMSHRICGSRIRVSKFR